MFGSITKVLFTDVHFFLFFHSTGSFGGDLTVQTTLVKQTKITGK